MYDYLDNENKYGTLVGSFDLDRNAEFKESFKSLAESFQSSFQMDAISDLNKILYTEAMRESYKQELIGDVLNEQFEDVYFAKHPEKLEQLIENSAFEIMNEASSVGSMAPVIGLSLPILKKNYLECHAKDIMMTEVPTKPFIKVGFDRKFLKDKQGKKHYIPDIFWDNSYKQVMSMAKGKPISNAWYPEGGTLPFQDLNILNASGGTLETRDSLAYDFVIEAVKIETGAEGAPNVKELTSLNITPDMHTGTFSYEVKTEGADGTVVKDNIVGSVDFYAGTVSIACTAGKITQVRFGGHLSNENNTETIELDREREIVEWAIPDGHKINTGLTVEKIKDYKALLNIDVAAELISDISGVLSATEDSEQLNFLDDSLQKWKTKKDLPFGYKDGFVETFNFKATPTTTVAIPNAQWISTELKYALNREIDYLKDKLKTEEIMFVMYGNPANITLLQDGVKWIIDEDTKVGGIQLEYKFGVMTENKNRIHVVSSLKVPRSQGIRIVAYPLTKNVITFKHYKYSFNIENSYRNPLTPLTPNIMGTSRYLSTELLPVQGEMQITGNDFGRVVNA